MAHILVVDDENNIRMTVRLALQHVGHTVDTAADGAEALVKFANGIDYDLVLLDQRMPVMEGLDVLKEMRRRDPTARIVMVTAFGTIDLAVEAIKRGATDFLRKPFTAEVLRGTVQTALQEKPLDPSLPAGEPISSITFGSTTINGFRIEFWAGSGERIDGNFKQVFTVHRPTGGSESCTVTLLAYVMELVKAHTDREQLPGGNRFWQALCEEALANYLWQNADFPPEQALYVEELTTGLRRFVDTVLTV